MASYRFNLAIIGAGPGGYVAAIRAGQLGMKVALVEREKVGGVCLNWGCIPTKALLRNAEVLSLFKRANEFGISFDNLQFDFAEAIKRSRRIAQRLSKGVEYLLKKNQVTLVFGEARLISARKIEVRKQEMGMEEVEADRVILATGSRPKLIPGLQVEGKRIITSNEALTLEELPPSLIIIGGGPVGVEFAEIYKAFGSEVTLIEMLPHILPLEDSEISTLLEKSLTKRGIRVITGAGVKRVEPGDGRLLVQISQERRQEEVPGDVVLVAVGRDPNVEGIGLEELGVEMENGFIKVKENFETSLPGLYAIGDVIGPPLLAHAAMAEGVAAVEGIAGIKGAGVNYGNIPSCTYCHPQVASIGLTEEKAKGMGYQIKVGRFPFQASGMAQTMGYAEGLVKVIAEADSGEILGLHILGPNATELIGEAGLARNLESTVEEIARTVHPHPTLSEAMVEAALAALGRAIHI
ncbi:MAG: dihydrolipoyl dehydrogenase [candidate division NC10 bacterium]|nr:dihydrolipoyl dehydrogenase [candidate division NC10 bacterium]